MCPRNDPLDGTKRARSRMHFAGFSKLDRTVIFFYPFLAVRISCAAPSLVVPLQTGEVRGKTHKAYHI